MPRISLEPAASGKADLFEHFERRAVKTRQGDVAHIAHVFAALRRGVEPTGSQITVAREKLRYFDQVRLRLCYETDVVADGGLSLVRECHERLSGSVPQSSFAIKPRKSLEQHGAVLALLFVWRADPLVEEI